MLCFANYKLQIQSRTHGCREDYHKSKETFESLTKPRFYKSKGKRTNDYVIDGDHRAISSSQSAANSPTFLMRSARIASKSSRAGRSRKVNSITQEDMFELIIKSQESRINDQRCDPELIQQAPTVPDEDFFGLILRLQSNRIDEQRCSLPENRRSNGNGTNPKEPKSQYRKESQL